MFQFLVLLLLLLLLLLLVSVCVCASVIADVFIDVSADLYSVDENATETPNAEGDAINSPLPLAAEAMIINRSFLQKCVQPVCLSVCLCVSSRCVCVCVCVRVMLSTRLFLLLPRQ